MGRYNTQTAPIRSKNSTSSVKTENLAGGEAYSQSAKLEFASILLTSFGNDKFYRTASEERKRMTELIEKLPLAFVAKAAIFARDEFGMRSITHNAAVEVAKRAGKERANWTKNFFRKVVVRPDDMTEILALWLSEQETGKTRIPNSMKKGFALALQDFNSYQLAKYRSENKSVSLVDVVNLVHPVPTEAITALVNGNLKTTGQTWEAKLSEAGKSEDVEEAKAEAWSELISTRKIGQMALLKNLRNVVEQAPDQLDAAINLLVNEGRVKSSRILPFRYATAYSELKKVGGKDSRKVLSGLSKALDIACSNVNLSGNTLIFLDQSGSMFPMGSYDYTTDRDTYHRSYTVNVKNCMNATGTPIQIGSLFAAILAKATDADVALWGDTTHFVDYDSDTNLLKLQEEILNSMEIEGTNLNQAFRFITKAVKDGKRKAYDRIILLSDMQNWVERSNPSAEFAAYEKVVGFRPHFYSFDLQGYGTMQFPQNRVYCIAGFSEKTLDLMNHLEEDPKALVHRIEAVSLD